MAIPNRIVLLLGRSSSILQAYLFEGPRLFFLEFLPGSPYREIRMSKTIQAISQVDGNQSCAGIQRRVPQVTDPFRSCFFMTIFTNTRVKLLA